jgi:hypothetical protein
MTEAGPKFRLIVDLPAGIARSASSMVGDGTRYETLSDLVSAALANQILLESDAADQPTTWGGHLGTAAAFPALGVRQSALTTSCSMDDLERPHLLLEPVRVNGTLSPFTNRLAPLVVPLRVIAQLQVDTRATVDWDLVVEFAARESRRAGLQIREADERAGRRGRRRRWTGWPVGADETASLARFRSHFLGRFDRDPVESPLTALGLMGYDAGRRVGLTAAGWDFACAATPVLGEMTGEGPLSPAQQHLLATGLARIPEEWERVESALRLLVQNEGAAEALDANFLTEHADWSASMAASLRSALIGRLLDAGLVSMNIATGEVFPVHRN